MSKPDCERPPNEALLVRLLEGTVTVGMTTADAGRMEALVIGVLLVWALVALGVAVVLGRGISLADDRAAAERPSHHRRPPRLLHARRQQLASLTHPPG
jgi:hypothetical protein